MRSMKEDRGEDRVCEGKGKRGEERGGGEVVYVNEQAVTLETILDRGLRLLLNTVSSII